MNHLLKVGIVGCGQIAREHLRAYQQTGTVKIAGVCDAEPTVAEKFAREIPAPLSESPAHMARTIRPDLVSICTPPGAHLENCRPFLERGIPILCEKPLAANLPDAETLATALEIAHFPDCVRTGRQPTPSVEDGLRVNQIVAAAYESARTRQRVSL